MWLQWQQTVAIVSTNCLSSLHNNSPEVRCRPVYLRHFARSLFWCSYWVIPFFRIIYGVRKKNHFMTSLLSAAIGNYLSQFCNQNNNNVRKTIVCSLRLLMKTQLFCQIGTVFVKSGSVIYETGFFGTFWDILQHSEMHNKTSTHTPYFIVLDYEFCG